MKSVEGLCLKAACLQIEGQKLLELAVSNWTAEWHDWGDHEDRLNYVYASDLNAWDRALLTVSGLVFLVFLAVCCEMKAALQQMNHHSDVAAFT